MSETTAWLHEGMERCAHCTEVLGGEVWHAEGEHQPFCLAKGATLNRRKRLIAPAPAPEGMRIELARYYGYDTGEGKKKKAR